MQVSRMTRTRKDSSASAGVLMSGAMQGTVGIANTVPGGMSLHRCTRVTKSP
jgi:hypothetical protein